MIHIREGRKPIDPRRFNEAFMMHASTSPFYPIIAANDVSAAMMDGPEGKALTEDSIREAVSFRKTVARLHAEFECKNEWFLMFGSRIMLLIKTVRKKYRFAQRRKSSWQPIRKAGFCIRTMPGTVSAILKTVLHA